MNSPATRVRETPPRPLVRIEALEKRFGPVQALCGVDLEVGRGEVVCIIGPSGCGKSTLLRCINGLQLPDAGRCRVDGYEIGGASRRDWRFSRRRDARSLDALRARVGMVFQQFNLWPHLTALENVAKAPIVVRGQEPEAARARAAALLSRVGLGDRANVYPDELSGGQRQRVGIARALAMEPVLMLFDEPTSSLDPELVGEVLAVMQELAKDGMTMICVTHETGFASRVADRVVFMEAGRIVEEGPPGHVLREPRTDRLKMFLSKLLQRGVSAPPAGRQPEENPEDPT